MTRKTVYDRIYRMFGQALDGRQLHYVPVTEVDPAKFDALMQADDHAYPRYMFLERDAFERFSSAELLQRIKNVQQTYRECYRFFVEEYPGGPYIGSLDVMSHPHGKSVELGYFVLPSYQRQGYATKMVEDAKAALPLFKTGIGARELTLTIEESGKASQGLAHKTGFVERCRYPSTHPHHIGEVDLEYVLPLEKQRSSTPSR